MESVRENRLEKKNTVKKVPKHERFFNISSNNNFRMSFIKKKKKMYINNNKIINTRSNITIKNIYIYIMTKVLNGLQ